MEHLKCTSLVRYAKGLDSKTLMFLASGEFLRKLCVRHRLIAAQMLLSPNVGILSGASRGPYSQVKNQARHSTLHRMTEYKFGIILSMFTLQQPAFKGGHELLCNCGSSMSMEDRYCQVMGLFIYQQTQVSLLEVLWFAI